jgi:hypothetical protein
VSAGSAVVPEARARGEGARGAAGAASLTITLAEPIRLVSAETGQVLNEVTTITLRAPRLGDLVAAMDAAGATQPGTMTLHLAARLSGLPVRDLEGLSLADGARLLDAVSGFMPAGLLTGGTGSPSSPGASASPATGASGGQPSSASGVHVPLSGARS